ncbi:MULTISPECIES: WD40/YVTN/BNR-like repeat-containing protein [unclassified Pseudoalteromonas]|uniref:WD40/YVTN/BNR-like repeat-containing protein n=1 Tax=unclassified Pseudoalteromonas TaxID=194690 RepID=UPI002075967D|nr:MULTISPECIES: YCF48-related protein [unclassified Pseudoalteromonas]
MIKKVVAASILTMAHLAVAESSDQIAPQSALMVAHPEQTLFTDITDTGKALVAVGKHGTIIYKKAEQKWTQASVPVQSLLTAVTFKGNDIGWACGHDASILKTTDGGKTWTVKQYLPQLEKPCLDIEFVNQQHGFAVGAYGMFFETFDGGESWNKRFISEFVHPDDVEYLNDLKEQDPAGYEQETAFILPHFNRLLITDDNMYLAGEMGLVAQSEDLGKTWQKFDSFYRGSFFSINETKDNHFVVAGLRGNAFIGSGQQVQQLKTDKTATINNIIVDDSTTYMLANSGVIFSIKNGEVTSKQLKNGHSILSGVLKNKSLVLATEQGIAEIEVGN